jgi:hypothetical protein
LVKKYGEGSKEVFQRFFGRKRKGKSAQAKAGDDIGNIEFEYKPETEKERKDDKEDFYQLFQERENLLVEETP